MRYLLYFIISLAARNVSSQTVLPSFSAVYNKAEDWSPSDESSLTAWWDASDISTLTGDPVTQMTSKKGTFTLQSIAGNSSSNPPDRTTINSLNALDFDMSSNEKLLTSQSNFNINDGNMIIVGAVVIEGVNNQKDAIWSIRDDNAPNNDIHLRAGNTSQFDGAFETEKLGLSGADLSGGFTRSFIGGPFSDNMIHASILDADNYDIYGRMNGVERLEIPDEYFTNVEMSNSVFIIHSNRSENRELDGKFMELMIFNSNDANLAIKAEGYLAHKWGLTGNLPDDHPYKSSAPHN